MVELNTISPFNNEIRPAPIQYKAAPAYFNGAPGQASWAFDINQATPDYADEDDPSFVGSPELPQKI